MSPSIATSKDALSALNTILACSPTMSGKVERRHLDGQECRHWKKRGRAPQAFKLSSLTYKKSVAHQLHRQRDRVLKTVIGKSAVDRAAFSRSLQKFEIGRARRGATQPKISRAALSLSKKAPCNFWT